MESAQCLKFFFRHLVQQFWGGQVLTAGRPGAQRLAAKALGMSLSVRVLDQMDFDFQIHFSLKLNSIQIKSTKRTDFMFHNHCNTRIID